jgi:aryl sulfotransferase
MQTSATEMHYPKKKREIYNHHVDSSIWNDFIFRDDDIIISTYGKSGTTWMQQIVSQLLFNGAEGLEVSAMSPWLDLRIPPKEVKLSAVESQSHRRFLKTHLPVDALVFSEKAKYIYVGRDGRDICWSLYNHHANASAVWYEALNETPGRVGPPIGPPAASVVEYYHEWFEKDGFPLWSLWENVRTWWDIRQLPNVLFVHFAKLKENMPREIRRIAKFIDATIDESAWEKVMLHCSFDYMKSNAAKSVPLGGIFWNGGADTFIHQGTNGRWRDLLSPADVAKYDQRAASELGSECAHWLATGELFD